MTYPWWCTRRVHRSRSRWQSVVCSECRSAGWTLAGPKRSNHHRWPNILYRQVSIAVHPIPSMSRWCWQCPRSLDGPLPNQAAHLVEPCWMFSLSKWYFPKVSTAFLELVCPTDSAKSCATEISVFISKHFLNNENRELYALFTW